MILKPGAEPVAGVFDRREIVGGRIQGVTHLFERTEDRPALFPRCPQGEVGGSGIALAIGLVKLGQRLGGAGMGVGQLLHVAGITFWTLHLDPILTLLLGIVPVYFFANFFTTKIFAQEPLVATSPCPKCDSLLTVYFGDLLSVQTDGIIPSAAGPPQPQITVNCGSGSGSNPQPESPDIRHPQPSPSPEPRP